MTSKAAMKLSASRLRLAAILCLAPIVLLAATEPWKKSGSQWTTEDVQVVLTNSPWSQSVDASFPDPEKDDPVPAAPLPGAEQAGMAGVRGASDGRWDGGVARRKPSGPPSLPVLVRWESAPPVREALLRSSAPDATTVVETAQKDYVIALSGLVPGGRYHAAGQIAPSSNSQDAVDARDPEQMLEGLMQYSMLSLKDGARIPAEDAKLDPPTGVVSIYFSKSKPINLDNKEVLFSTRFGSLKIEKRFRLKDMIYQGRLAL